MPPHHFSLRLRLGLYRLRRGVHDDDFVEGAEDDEDSDYQDEEGDEDSGYGDDAT